MLMYIVFSRYIYSNCNQFFSCYKLIWPKFVYKLNSIKYELLMLVMWKGVQWLEEVEKMDGTWMHLVSLYLSSSCVNNHITSNFSKAVFHKFSKIILEYLGPLIAAIVWNDINDSILFLSSSCNQAVCLSYGKETPIDR